MEKNIEKILSFLRIELGGLKFEIFENFFYFFLVDFFIFFFDFSIFLWLENSIFSKIIDVKFNNKIL